MAKKELSLRVEPAAIIGRLYRVGGRTEPSFGPSLPARRRESGNLAA